MARPGIRKRRLQVCAENLVARRPDILRALAELGCVVEAEPCLDQCPRCEACTFALVGGRYLFVDSPDALLSACSEGIFRHVPEREKEGAD